MIYGIANVAQTGWGDTWTVLPVTVGVATLAAFIAWERRCSGNGCAGSTAASADVLGFLHLHGASSLAQASAHGNNAAFIFGALMVLAAGLTAAWLITGEHPVAASASPEPSPATTHGARSAGYALGRSSARG